MKRTNLTTAVIAAIAGVAGISNMANAVYLNADGTGQVLIYPYYTVNNGNNTILTVVNTTSQGKAIKVRHLEGYDSREVLDYNLYMSPYDVWSAEIVNSGSGAGILTSDNSCTVPKIVGQGIIPFQSGAYDGTQTGANANDGGSKSITRTLEGYTEMIEMGTVTNATNGSLTALSHVDGVPNNCAQLVNAWALSGGGSAAYWTANRNIDIAAASGGLFGSGTIIDVARGTVEGYNADAIDNFWDPNAQAFDHEAPGTLNPNLSNSQRFSYVFAKSASGGPAALTSSSWGDGQDAVSALFMADSIYNEYWTDSNLNLSSEWVVTMPTKRFYVDPKQVTSVVEPFDVLFSSANGGTSCSPILVNYYDEEEAGAPGATVIPPCFSPQICIPVPTSINLCYEANVVTFNQTGSASNILGSKLTTSVTTGHSNGWAQIDLVNAAPTQHVLTDSNGTTYGGLPVTGFWVTQFDNSAVKVSGSYSALYKHRYSRTINLGSSAD